ncbi:LemA family protein [Treponema brennaborense]|uniref:LemA family protein n=1 Tax=Treponema brennaborense (strain DSM 12168 / CIP 105900 / DD5/3) TaxID=906968 RepID=F4LMF6_TREBD|nr:LemA family protein [Treponema brennaborense]AEE15718.1 LemA family protein [Treponema brennaborense DSM 12168]
MKSGTKILLVVVGLLVVLGIAGCQFYSGTYNKMVALDEQVSGQWAQVQNVYQRRLDLIPNLVATVKGYASHESQVFTQIAEARAKAGGVVQISAADLDDPAKMKQFQEAQSSLGGALQRLLAVTENYPELKANENFLALQDQLEGTENRITVERGRFNESVTSYNTFIRQFPKNIIANMSGFRTKEKFSADSAAQSAPAVSFE